MDDAFKSIASDVFALLTSRGQILVTAESCSAGLIAATLATMPGMSTRLAGGFIVYQIESKQNWLGIAADKIVEHGVVSEKVASLMASAALDRTVQATVAVSITGHLGPGAPKELDGVAWMAIAARDGAMITHKFQLASATLHGSLDDADFGRTLRCERQIDAMQQVLRKLIEWLQRIPRLSQLPTT